MKLTPPISGCNFNETTVNEDEAVFFPIRYYVHDFAIDYNYASGIQK
jgi:hypothetical protein